MKIIQSYKNGDTKVILFDNGTRILDNMTNEPFHLEWPVSVDLNISNYCEKGCSFCYQNCTRNGKSADLDKIITLLHPNMEVAININVGFKIDLNFLDFLEKCRDNNIVVNATINQDDLKDRLSEIVMLQDYGLLHGIGVSYTGGFDNMGNVSHDIKHLRESLNNVVIHVIAGLIDPTDLEMLKDYGYNVLILGYKQKGRAEKNELPNMNDLIDWLSRNINNFGNSVICFDNLAIKQLKVREMVSDDKWEIYYQGDEGTISMYINGVDMTFAQNSFTSQHYDIKGYNIQEMFDIVRKEK